MPHGTRDLREVDELIGLLARAVQQLQTYPSGSPLCTTAIDACHRSLAALRLQDRLTCRVTPTELVVDGAAGRETAGGRELARRLHSASVAAVTLERGATAREIARFCESLLRCAERGSTAPPLAELMAEHGIERITVEMALRPAVLEAGATDRQGDGDLRGERARFEEHLAGGAVNYLYPPHTGWMRVDPSLGLERVTLLDVAVLAGDPGALASMLLQLTGEGACGTPAQALQNKYSDVILLISSLEPQTARRLLGRLARAVLDLSPEDRQALLRRTILPGLLDGRVDGAVLREFPDPDLAESLCLLLDLEAAAPELLTSALSRLDLSPERREAVVPLVDAALREREAAACDSARRATLLRHARELVRVDESRPRSFADFEAFDLSMDEGAVATLDGIRQAVPEADAVTDRLTCLWHLTRLVPNPDVVSGLLHRSFSLLSALEGRSRGHEVPGWLKRFRELAGSVRAQRPDVAATIAECLATFCTPARAEWVIDLSMCDEGGREAADAFVDAVGTAAAAPIVAVLDRESAAEPQPGARDRQARGRAAADLLRAHMGVLAPAVASLLAQCRPAARRTLLRLLGAAGAGTEDAIAEQIPSADDGVAREALRALARVGTPRAAGHVLAEIARQGGARSLAAEETLWHFPAPEAQRHARDLLARREFTIAHPQAAERLIDRAVRAGAADLGAVLVDLAPMRFRIWNRGLARVARKAHKLLLQPAALPSGAPR